MSSTKKQTSPYYQGDLIFIIAAFFLISVVSIYSAVGGGLATKQVLYYLLGILVVIGLLYFDLEQLEKLSLYVYIGFALLCAILLVSPSYIGGMRFAEPVNNAKSWFFLPGFSLQPSEFMKIGIIMYMASVIGKATPKGRRTLKEDIFLLLKIFAIAGIPILLIMQQPDFGTSMVIVFIMGVMIFLSGINWRLIAIVGGSAATIITLAFYIVINFPDFAENVLHVQRYQIDRVMTFVSPEQQDPDAKLQSENAVKAIGSGELTGNGIGNLKVHVPEAETDFIFAVIGESFGFLGCTILVIFFFYLIYRLVVLTDRIFAFNKFASYFCIGYTALIVVHTFQNIGMNIGLMPITGIPLLFISYGGSSVLATLIGFAIVYNSSYHLSKYQSYMFK